MPPAQRVGSAPRWKFHRSVRVEAGSLS